MTTPDRRYTSSHGLVNFSALVRVESSGWIFRTHCDTEVLLAALRQWGVGPRQAAGDVRFPFGRCGAVLLVRVIPLHQAPLLQFPGRPPCLRLGSDSASRLRRLRGRDRPGSGLGISSVAGGSGPAHYLPRHHEPAPRRMLRFRDGRLDIHPRGPSARSGDPSRAPPARNLCSACARDWRARSQRTCLPTFLRRLSLRGLDSAIVVGLMRVPPPAS